MTHNIEKKGCIPVEYRGCSIKDMPPLSVQIPWNKGKKNPYSKETLKKMSESHKRRLSNPKNHPMYGKRGKDAPNWRGKGKLRATHVDAQMKFGLLGPGKGIYRYGVIHHMDRDVNNNEWDNLELLSRADHCKLHLLEDWNNGTRTNMKRC